MADHLRKIWLLLFLGWCVQEAAYGHESPCSQGNGTQCLEAVRNYLHRTDWWFGNSFSSECPGVPPGSDVTSFRCYNPSSFKTIGSRLMQREDFQADNVEQVLRIRYFAPRGSYWACGHRFRVPEVTMGEDVDSTHEIYYDTWSLRHRPAVIWKAVRGEMYSLVAYDVGEMRMCGIWVNIEGGDSALGQELAPYCEFMNPLYRDTVMVFALFRQNETIPNKEKQAVVDKFWGMPDQKYLLPEAISDLGHRINEPMALSYLTLRTDPFSIQTYKDRSLMNNCPFLAARSPGLIKVMDTFNLTSRFKTALDHRGLYFSDLEVEVEVKFWSDEIMFTSCCSHQHEKEKIVSVDPLSHITISPVHLRYPPDILLSPVEAMDKLFFTGKWFTILLVDVTAAHKGRSDSVTSVLWMVTDHHGPSVSGQGKVHRHYTTPTPPLGEKRLYMFLVFRQTGEFGIGFNFSEFCINGDSENCNFDLFSLVSTYKLHFSGVNWFSSSADHYTRAKMYEADPSKRAAACQGVRGYADPCPPTICPSTPAPTQPPNQRTTPRGGNGAESPATNFLFLINLFLFTFVLSHL